MKFAHLSDTHLGATNFKLKEREEDFLRAFDEAIDICIKENVEFVIHSGDLFDKPNPSYHVLRFCMRKLKELYRRKIPFIIIPGSHDLGVEGSPVSLLEEIGYVINLQNFFKEEGGKFKLEGIELPENKVFICGVPGIRSEIRKIYKNLEIRPREGYYNIFAFHHTLAEIPEVGVYADIDAKLLPKGFDYYAAGHYHSKIQLQIGSSMLNYPGSTEYCDLTEIEHDKEKGFFLIEDNRAKWIRLNTRNFIVQPVNCNNLSPDQVVELCRKMIRPSRGGILILKLMGRLSKGNRNEIDREAIENFAKENGYLFVKIYSSELLNPDSIAVLEIKKKSLEEIEEEYLRRQKYDEGAIKLAKLLISHLGKELKPSEVNEICSRLYKVLMEGIKVEDQEPPA